MVFLLDRLVFAYRCHRGPQCVNRSVQWAYSQGGFDAWTGVTEDGHPNCPSVRTGRRLRLRGTLFHIQGPHGPELVVVRREEWRLLGRRRGHGEKSWGNAGRGRATWAASNGERRPTGPASMWPKRTLDRVAYTPEGSDQSISYCSWAALDPATGAILWQTPDPSEGIDLGAVSSANGVVYAESMCRDMYALSGATGQVLWSFTGAGSSIAGPAIVNGVVYWGNGYDFYGGAGSTTFYAFHLAPAGAAGVDHICSMR